MLAGVAVHCVGACGMVSGCTMLMWAVILLSVCGRVAEHWCQAGRLVGSDWYQALACMPSLVTLWWAGLYTDMICTMLSM
jgi:hypothetical protein